MRKDDLARPPSGVAGGGTGLQTREYGSSGPRVVVLHGGPGAPGSMAPVAQELGKSFNVLEPLQRGSGAEPLTVARHVADLHELVESRFRSTRPALVGHSWGAMLGLVYAATHPGRVRSLVLVGCGTFDITARDRLRATREQRMDPDLRRHMEHLPQEVPDPDERLRIAAGLLRTVDSYELVSNPPEIDACDARAYRETWDDMVGLQEAGVYPAAFATIDAPVIMLHGTFDPHPGPAIRGSLLSHLPQLEYREWEQCGHYPWLEKAVREEFFSALREWLLR